MQEEQLRKLLKLRQYIIECHNSLDGKDAASVAVIKQSKVAYEFSQMIKKIDDILVKHVRIEGRK